MNSTTADPIAPPPPPPQPPRSSFSCERHPVEQFTGFCPSCLCERLVILDKSSSNNTPSSSRRPSSASAAAAAAIKSLFSSNPKPAAVPQPPTTAPKHSKPSFLPELRRTKSFSASKNEAHLGLSFEPQRKSCDVRARNTLSSLFTLDDGTKTAARNSTHNNKPIFTPAPPIASISHLNPLNAKKIESSVVNKPVSEENENDEDFKDPDYFHDSVIVCDDESSDDGDEIRPVTDTHLEISRNSAENETNGNINTIAEEADTASVSSLKPMKHHVGDNTQEKKSSGGGMFSAAASVFSKKWHKWRQKQKTKKPPSNFATLPVDEKPISKQYRETQSEIADYGFGRRSCDTGPRFSLDAARISLEDPRYSFDEPRASWDGHSICRSFSRMAPMVSVMEDMSPPAAAPHISRSDMQIPVEGNLLNCTSESENMPGGSILTREYYLDSSSSRRRKSLDRSNSTRKTVADELIPVCNTKISPASTHCFNRAKVMAGENDNTNNSRDSSIHSQSFLRDDCYETFELGNGVFGESSEKDKKKSRRWSWRIWGFSFTHRRSSIGTSNSTGQQEKYCRGKGVERSFSESWHDLRTENGSSGRFHSGRNVSRSNSSVSLRSGSCRIGGPGLFGNMRKKRDEYVLEKNRSAKQCSGGDGVDNGLLRFYLTPMRNSRRGGLKTNDSHSITRSVLRLY